MKGPDSSYSGAFVFQPNLYLIDIEFPASADFLGGASREEPVVYIPRPYVQLFGELVSVHFLKREKLLGVILLLCWKRIKEKVARFVTAVILRQLAFKVDLKLPL